MLQPTNSYNISILATIQLSNAKESRPTLQSEVPSVSKLHRLSRASYKGFQNGKGGHESMKQHTRYSCELCLFKKGKKKTPIRLEGPRMLNSLKKPKYVAFFCVRLMEPKKLVCIFTEC